MVSRSKITPRALSDKNAQGLSDPLGVCTLIIYY